MSNHSSPHRTRVTDQGTMSIFSSNHHTPRAEPSANAFRGCPASSRAVWAIVATAVAAAGLSGIGVSLPARATEPSGTWNTTGELATTRFAHTQTLLSNGKIFLAGGETASAEIYDPANGESELTGSMSTSRRSHTATLLKDGRVLVVGGLVGTNKTALSSAEVFDPGTGQWSSAGTLPGDGRADHTATLLPNGKVVVAGGFKRAESGCMDTLNDCEGVSSTAIFDPLGQEPWAEGKPMSTVRARHSATVLPDGKILFAGGGGAPPPATGNYDDAGTGSSADLYDPDTGLSVPTAPLVFNRWGHTATLLPSGKVIVAGGLNCGTSPPRLPVGGSANINLCGTTSSSEMYDPLAGAWSPASSFSSARMNHTATLLGGPSCEVPTAMEPRPGWCGKVLAAGGRGAESSAELFDPAVEGRDDAGRPVQGSWVPAGSLVRSRDLHTATYLGNGQVLAAGGYEAGLGVEMFQPTATLRRPSVVRLEPATGPTSGKSRVVIKGAGFSDVTSVRFGERDATFYRVDSATTITAASPPTDHPETVHVTVTVASSNTSVRTAADLFTYHSPNGTWSATTAMTTARSHHTVTVLKNGRVLVAGGLREGKDGPPTRSSELYNPATETWGAVAPMKEARAWHTATALPDGKVLVTGGYATISGDTGAPLSSSELYDPVTNTWHATGAMNQARIRHTATVLDDGSVLVVGGGPQTSEIYKAGAWTTERELHGSHFRHTATLLRDHRSVLVAGSTAEIYDIGTHRWTTSRNLRQPRSYHTAALLPDGRVLIAGGVDYDDSSKKLDTSEIYDPDAQTWTLTMGRLGQARADHTATDLGSGRILVAGGGTAAAEIYEFVLGSWVPALPLIASRTSHAATLLPGPDQRVLITGGRASHDPRLASAELFHIHEAEPRLSVLNVTPPIGPSSGGSSINIIGSGFFHPETIVQIGGVPAARTIIASDREIIAITPPHPPGSVDVQVTRAGRTGSGRYDFAFGGWELTAPLTPCTPPSSACLPRFNHTATALADGRVLVAGSEIPGANFDTTSIQRGKTTAAQIYDPRTAGWAAATPMLAPRSHHTATLLADGSVLVVGRPEPGQVNGKEFSETYDPGTDTWTATPLMNVSRERYHTATRLQDNTVMVTGGHVGAAAVSASELYDPATRRWSLTGSLNVPRRHHTATLVNDGQLVVVGGEESTGAELDSTEVYDPQTNAWNAAESPLAEPRSHHTATLLDDGRILVSGGEGREGDTASAEIFDPRTRTWVPAGPLAQARSGHSATKLPDGRVLITGGLINGTELQSSEVYDPAADLWSYAGSTVLPRVNHAATGLVGTVCGASCGRVLVTGGAAPSSGSAELFTSSPEIIRLSLEQGPSTGGTTVVITGRALDGAKGVRFGDAPAERFTIDSPTQITAVTPPHGAGTVEVVVTTPGGSSLANPPRPNEFTFISSGVPGRITDLAAKVLSEAAVELSWTTAGSDGVFGPPATRYVVKESTSPITSEDEFSAATTVCEGGCSFPAAALGRPIVFSIDGLAPGTGYNYAVRAIGPNGMQGPISNAVSVTTAGSTPVLDVRCPRVPAPAPNEILYPGGYSMVGLPAGTRLDAQSPLYSWFDLGARGSYATQSGGDPVAEGRGYWAWFSCPRLVSLGSEGTEALELPLGGYRASMVGNPSGREASGLSGHDFAARWDPGINEGAGGYHISGHREEQTLPVGGATWVFSYRDTAISLRAG